MLSYWGKGEGRIYVTVKITCDRCGKIVEREKLISMGSTNANTSFVCKECEKYWRGFYIKKLYSLGLDPMGFHKKWEEFYDKFLKDGNKREVVEFT